jgi:hypothetical protein
MLHGTSLLPHPHHMATAFWAQLTFPQYLLPFPSFQQYISIQLALRKTLSLLCSTHFTCHSPSIYACKMTLKKAPSHSGPLLTFSPHTLFTRLLCFPFHYFFTVTAPIPSFTPFFHSFHYILLALYWFPLLLFPSLAQFMFTASLICSPIHSMSQSDPSQQIQQSDFEFTGVTVNHTFQYWWHSSANDQWQSHTKNYARF